MESHPEGIWGISVAAEGPDRTNPCKIPVLATWVWVRPSQCQCRSVVPVASGRLSCVPSSLQASFFRISKVAAPTSGETTVCIRVCGAAATNDLASAALKKKAPSAAVDVSAAAEQHQHRRESSRYHADASGKKALEEVNQR